MKPCARHVHLEPQHYCQVIKRHVQIWHATRVDWFKDPVPRARRGFVNKGDVSTGTKNYVIVWNLWTSGAPAFRFDRWQKIWATNRQSCGTFRRKVAPWKHGLGLQNPKVATDDRLKSAAKGRVAHGRCSACRHVKRNGYGDGEMERGGDRRGGGVLERSRPTSRRGVRLRSRLSFRPALRRPAWKALHELMQDPALIQSPINQRDVAGY